MARKSTDCKRQSEQPPILMSKKWEADPAGIMILQRVSVDLALAHKNSSAALVGVSLKNRHVLIKIARQLNGRAHDMHLYA